MLLLCVFSLNIYPLPTICLTGVPIIFYFLSACSPLFFPLVVNLKTPYNNADLSRHDNIWINESSWWPLIRTLLLQTLRSIEKGPIRSFDHQMLLCISSILPLDHLTSLTAPCSVSDSPTDGVVYKLTRSSLRKHLIQYNNVGLKWISVINRRLISDYTVPTNDILTRLVFSQ